MKIRFSSQQITVRVTEDQWREFKAERVLIEKFWLSETKPLKVRMELAARSHYEGSTEGLVLRISESDLRIPQSKRDSVWELQVGAQLRVAVEIDLFSQKKTGKRELR